MWLLHPSSGSATPPSALLLFGQITGRGGEGAKEGPKSWALDGQQRVRAGVMEGLWPRRTHLHSGPTSVPNCHVAAQLTSCWAIPEAWSLALGSCGIGVGWADFSVLGGDLEGLILSLE